MLATSKIKWFGSIILAGILLALALMGGNWGTNYTASASVNAAPFIESIYPSVVPAGSPDTTMIISGANFGNTTDTRVRLTGVGVDLLLTPLQVIPDGISVSIMANLLVVPNLYIVTVVKTTSGTVPTIPFPPGMEVSNPVPFTVYEPLFTYLPLIYK